MESGDVVGANDAEMTSVESAHIGDIQSFRRSDDASVGAAQTKICVADDQLCHAPEVVVGGRRELVPLIGERQSQVRLGVGTQVLTDEVEGFAENGRDDDERRLRRGEELLAGEPIGVLPVRGGDQNARVDEDCYCPNPSASNASTSLPRSASEDPASK